MRNGPIVLGLLACGLLPFLGWVAAADATERGYLGVYLSPQAVDEGATAEGVLVEKVAADGPAAKAGVEAGDRIISAAGETVQAPGDVVKIVKERKPGDPLALELKRNDEAVSVTVTLGSLDAVLPAAPEAPAEASAQGFLGVGAGPVHPAVAAHLHLESGTGTLIGDVWKDSPADKAGLAEYDVILSVDGEPVQGSLNEMLAGKKPGDKVEIEYIHGGEKKTVEVALGERPAELPPMGFAPPASQGPLGKLWVPDHGHRGRLLLKRPDGQQHAFPLPGDLLGPDGSMDIDQLMKEMEKHFSEFWTPDLHGDMSGRIRSLLENAQRNDGGPQWSETRSSSMVLRHVDGEYDVTIREENGDRTVDVKKGEEVLAENLPWDEVKTLPEAARKIVEKVASEIQSPTIQRNAPKLPKKAPSLPRDKSLKA